ncbi:MAG TPA: hypothetical protein DCR15_11255 [Arthrobacter bacterium]|nr:hypothetical protein [Arthrobacter sp.]
MTEIFGEPVEDLVAMSLGGGAGLATSAFVYPKLSGIGGGLLSNKLVGAIAQGGLTAFSAVLEGDLLVKHVTSTHNAEKFKAGGVLIGFVQAVGNIFGGLPYSVTGATQAQLTNPFAGILGSGSATPKAASATTASTNYAPSRVQGI